MTTFTSEDRINAYSHYLILDEFGQPMRKIRTKHEADELLKTYTNWSARFVKGEKQIVDLPDAPF